jgi:Coenzyme PQQ synthesis protein D (PqqD)
MIDRDSCPKRGDQVIAQKAANDLLLFNMEDGNYYSLNEVGSRVWELCDGTHNVSQVVAAIAGEYDASDQVLEKDVLELLEDFRKGKLIA